MTEEERERLIKKLREKAKYNREHKEEILMDWITNHLVLREKPFVHPDDIPDIPVIREEDVYKKLVVPNLIKLGAIPKNKLVVGKTYIGACRNTTEAKWNGEEFEYKRYKLGDWFDDTINHFEDFTTYDIFIPIEEVN